jgi:FkbM family methyltransferase
LSITSAIAAASHLLSPALRSRVKRALYIPDALSTMQQMSKLGLKPKVALDIGAYVGEWSRDLRLVFPDCTIAMFEPQPSKRVVLEDLAASMGSAKVFPVLLGGKLPERVAFRLGETGSSYKPSVAVAAGLAQRPPSIEMETVPLDAVLAGTPYQRADVVKIDVQGAEADVIEGGVATLMGAEVVFMELSLVQQYQGGKLAHDVIRTMADMDLLPYDITYIRRNTPSGACNEIDVAFVRSSSPLFAMHHFRA